MDETGAEPGVLVEALVQRYQQALHAYASRLLGADDSAQDIVQETWVALCLQVQRQSPCWASGAQMLAWLRAVVKHKALNYLKARRRSSHVAAGDALRALRVPSPDLPESSALRADISHALYQAIGSLRRAQREVIVYRFFYGYSLPEIIEVLGLPLNTVKARLARGKKQLLSLLRERGVERSDLEAWTLRWSGTIAGG